MTKSEFFRRVTNKIDNLQMATENVDDALGTFLLSCKLPFVLLDLGDGFVKYDLCDDETDLVRYTALNERLDKIRVLLSNKSEEMRRRDETL